MKLKKFLASILSLAMVLSLAACGGDSGEDAASGDGADGGEQSITLGFAQVGSESEWRTANTDNIKASAEEAGITLQFSDAQQKQENQIKAIRSFIASDVDVISFCPIVETGWDTVLQEAKDAGIPVVLVDRGVTADPSLYVTHIFADALKEGANAFNWIDEYMTSKGKTPRAGGDQFQVAILEGTVGSSVAADRLQGFLDAMDASENSAKYNVLCSQTGEYTRAKGMEVMESFLKSDGDKIDILFSCNGDMALGAIDAIRSAGLALPLVVGVDATAPALEAAAAGTLQGTVLNDAQGIARAMLDLILALSSGEDPAEAVTLEDGHYVWLPYSQITRETLELSESLPLPSGPEE